MKKLTKDAAALLRLSGALGIGLGLTGLSSGEREKALVILSGIAGDQNLRLGVEGAVKESGITWVELESWLEKSDEFAQLFGLAERALTRAMRHALKHTLFNRALRGYEAEEIRPALDKSGYERVKVTKIDNSLGRYLLQELGGAMPADTDKVEKDDGLDQIQIFPTQDAAKKAFSKKEK